MKKTLSVSEVAIRAAKPFPSPYCPGHDICQISRIAAILRDEATLSHWARRVFTRLEWPALVRRFEQAGGIGKDSNMVTGVRGYQQSRKEDTLAGEGGRTQHPPFRMLPTLPIYTQLSQESNKFEAAFADESSPLRGLVRHLAGRWAAKEALIKAHRHRRLYMHEISILQAGVESSEFGKPFALVDPVCNTIVMKQDVAALRGLRGSDPQSLRKAALASKLKTNDGTQTIELSSVEASRTFRRRAMVNASDRQSAEISISHDGDMASAVSMVYDPPVPQPEEEDIVDDGIGAPIHEPQAGDKGWLDDPV